MERVTWYCWFLVLCILLNLPNNPIYFSSKNIQYWRSQNTWKFDWFCKFLENFLSPQWGPCIKRPVKKKYFYCSNLIFLQAYSGELRLEFSYVHGQPALTLQATSNVIDSLKPQWQKFFWLMGDTVAGTALKKLHSELPEEDDSDLYLYVNGIIYHPETARTKKHKLNSINI